MFRFLRDWALIIAMVAGVLGFLILDSFNLPGSVKHILVSSVHFVQPVLIFFMLFLTFCRISFSELSIKKWHLWLVIIQGLLFLGIAVILMSMPQSGLRIILEGAMICLICPTATAGAVITRKLGGDAASITTYTILINLVTALLVPMVVPLVHPAEGAGFITAGMKILSKVFPLLLLPLVLAIICRRWFPTAHRVLSTKSEWSFYLWIIALTLALAVTAHSVSRSEIDVVTQIGLIIVSLVCCVAQFIIGRKVGRRYNESVTAGQSMGQKNTVLAIWIGYTFFTPVTALVGGFYSIWHNLINSAQLYHHYHSNQKNID